MHWAHVNLEPAQETQGILYLSPLLTHLKLSKDQVGLFFMQTWPGQRVGWAGELAFLTLTVGPPLEHRRGEVSS